MKNKILSLITLVLIFILASCDGPTGTVGDRTIKVTDMVGRKVYVDLNNNDSIVCIGPGALRLYTYVGEVAKLVGAEDIDRSLDNNPYEGIPRPYYDLHKSYLSSLPSVGVGGDSQSVDVDKLKLTNPTLIISSYEDKEQATALQDAVGVPVIVISYGSGQVFDLAIQESITLLGKVLERENRAIELNSYIIQCKNDMMEKAKVASAEQKRSFYIGCLGGLGKQSLLTTNNNFPLFSVSSIKNSLESLTELESGTTNITIEDLLSLNPDVIIVDSAGVESFKAQYQANKETYDSLDAFKTGNIYLELAFNCYQTNIELCIMNAYYIASIAFPHQYAGFNVDVKSNEVCEMFLGSQIYTTVIKKVPYAYGGLKRIALPGEFFGS